MDTTANKRFAFYIPEDAFVPGHGFRVSIVFEDESGYYPTGHWPWQDGGKMPWFWGQTLDEARAIARQANAKLGLSDLDADLIVTSSIAAGIKEQRGRRRKKGEPW